MLVGNRYYQELYTANSKGFPKPYREVRNPPILLDHFRRQGIARPEEVLLHVPKYEGYANVPDFVNYRRSVKVKDHYSYLNLSYPLALHLSHTKQPHRHDNLP